MAYAEGTKVDSFQSRMEIEKLIVKFKGTDVIIGSFNEKTMVQFRARGRFVRISLPVPTAADKEIRFNGQGRVRTSIQVQNAIATETKRRWRCVLLLIKAKFTAIEDGIVTFEDEFMAETVMPDGKTAKEHIQPQIAAAYETGKMATLQIGFQP